MIEITVKPEARRQKPGGRHSSACGRLPSGFWLLAFGLTLFFPRLAFADLVRLKNGRVLSVESWQIRGEVAVLELRDGGHLEAPDALIDEVLPDEYLHAKIQALPASIVVAEAAGPEELRALISDTAARYGVDVRLAHAVVRVESNYRPGAVSPKGAKGLMQLMPSVAQLYAVSDPFNPAQNLDAGLRHLRGLLDRFHNDVSRALAAYNAGIFAVAKYGGIPPYRETQDYVRRILALAAR